MQRSNISAFVQCLDTGTAPASGYARTLTASNVNSASLSNDWSVLEAQTIGGTNIDLIVKGQLDGHRRGFIFVTSSNLYQSDQRLSAPLTRAQLATKVLNGGTLTVMGVPPGTGTRLGIDQNLDGVLDGDTPAPAVRIARATPATVITWSTNAAGFVLETSSSIPTTNWTAETSVRGLVGGEFNITNTPTGTRFYRLNEL